MIQSQVYAFNKASAIGLMVNEDGTPITSQAHRFTAIQHRREARKCLQSSFAPCAVQTPPGWRFETSSQASHQKSGPCNVDTWMGSLLPSLRSAWTCYEPAWQGAVYEGHGHVAQRDGAIGDGDESKYQEWFWKGLNDGEGLVEKVIAALTPPPLREKTIQVLERQE